jgi:hypothetical protein
MDVRLAVRGSRPDQEVRSRPHNDVSEGSNQRAGVDDVINKGLAAKRSTSAKMGASRSYFADVSRSQAAPPTRRLLRSSREPQASALGERIWG